MVQGEDWLDAQPSPFASAEQVEALRLQQAGKEYEFAQLYRIFGDDERGRRLLEQWTQAIEDKEISPGASHAEYAFWEGQRVFIRKIRKQLALAANGGPI